MVKWWNKIISSIFCESAKFHYAIHDYSDKCDRLVIKWFAINWMACIQSLAGALTDFAFTMSRTAESQTPIQDTWARAM